MIESTVMQFFLDNFNRRQVCMEIGAVYKKGKDIAKMSYYFRFLKQKKVKEKLILIESKNGEDLAGNMFRLIEELQNGDYESYTICIPYTEQKKEEIINRIKNKKNIIFVRHHSFSYYKYLGMAKYLFTDSTFGRSFIKKDGQILTNTWHGTPLKKMGYALDDSVYAMGNVQRNLLQADYLVYPNIYMEEKMIEAYQLDGLYEGTILEEGYPRNTVFFSNSEKGITKKELGLDGKEVYMYMPTWRGFFNQKDIDAFLKVTEEHLQYIDKNLSEQQILYVKFHTFVDKSLDFSKYKKIKPFPKQYDIYECLNLCDGLITDYSSVFYDFANTGKKIILFAYDEEQYLKDRGIYTPLETLPFPIVKTVEQLIKELHPQKEYDDTEFKKRYCTFDNKDAAKKICQHIIKEQRVCQEKKIFQKRKERVLIYGGSFKKNGITTSLLSLLNELDLNKREYYITFEEAALKEEPERIRILPEGVKILPISGTARLTFSEVIAFLFYFKGNRQNKLIRKKLDRLYKRELRRHFGSITIDYVIHFTGYEKKITNLLERFPCHRTIFVHNDMVAEMAAKANQHVLTLQEAYRNYDKVAVVTRDIVPPTREIGGNGANIVVINNCHNHTKVIEQAQEEIIFHSDTVSNYSFEQIQEILQTDSLKFINVGRFSKEKGQHMLIEAFSLFEKKHPESYLFIVGGYGSEYDTIVEHAKETSNHIVIIKAIINPMPLIKQCDLFILSSFYEGLGLTLLEADSLGVPVISTDIAGPKQFMQEHGGYLVEPTKKGILKGMEAYLNQEVVPMQVDYDIYNKKAVEQFETLFRKE